MTSQDHSFKLTWSFSAWFWLVRFYAILDEVGSDSTFSLHKAVIVSGRTSAEY